MYAGVLLDLYGTLVHDDDDLLMTICARIAEQAGVAVSTVSQEWDGRINRLADSAHGSAFRSLAELNLQSLTETVTHFGAALDPAQLSQEQMRFWRRPPLFADSLEFLRGLEAPVCLVSDVDRDDLDAVLTLSGIVVDAVVTSEDARAYKPRPEPFELALKTLGRQPSEVVHIGNSLTSDVAGASALGIDTAWVNRGATATTTEPTYVVAALPELLPRINR